MGENEEWKSILRGVERLRDISDVSSPKTNLTLRQVQAVHRNVQLPVLLELWDFY